MPEDTALTGSLSGSKPGEPVETSTILITTANDDPRCVEPVSLSYSSTTVSDFAARSRLLYSTDMRVVRHACR